MSLEKDEDFMRRAEGFVDTTIEGHLTDILFQGGQKIADEINELKRREVGRRGCHCNNCSFERQSLAEKKVGDLNWYIGMLEPSNRNSGKLEVYREGRTWGVKKIINLEE